jgi:hypothetical protein
MTRMHPRYHEARRQLRDLPRLYPSLFDQTTTIGRQWTTALEKDATGQQCVRLVDDLVERLTPMKR